MFAKPKRIRPDDELEIVYEVQWKTPGYDDDKAKIIGILDTPDTNLDWNTFKSYLIQNSGNMRLSTSDIRISYVDSDEDTIPVDSELEFRECLKFSRIRARHGRKVIMKVSSGAKPKEKGKSAGKVRLGEEKKESREGKEVKDSKPRLFCVKKKDIGGDEVPEWFENYMAKFKADLIQEIKETMLPQPKLNVGPSMPYSQVHSRRSVVTEPPMPKYHVGHLIEKRKKKKKMSEEDSSDCTDGLQLQWEEKLELLRHMQKISKREKKFEKKLDAKLEKLESKTKKIMEKKSHGLFGDGKPCPDGKRRARAAVLGASAPLTPPSENVMDALPVDEYTHVPHVRKGEIVTQVWKVVNNGYMAWSDETELRFAWGSTSLVPLTTMVKCPSLQPGDSGKVKVKLQAPMFPGSFESYWHFHHGGRRFGHWLGCAVIVEPDAKSDPALVVAAVNPTSEPVCTEKAVDLTMKCVKPESGNGENGACGSKKYVNSSTDDMKMYEEGMEKSEDKEEQASSSHPVDKPLSLDLNSWTNYYSQPQVPVADLLNIKEPLETEREKEVKIENVTQTLSNLTIYGIPEQWKDSEIPAETQEPEKVKEEYNSASDSDNISVISGTISVDSEDTDPSEEFVVIPMPQCFNCEQALGENLAVTQPISVEIPRTEDEAENVLQASDNNNNMELKPYPAMPMFLPVLVTPENTQGQESGYSEGEPDPPIEDDKDPNNVYVRDPTGKPIPVAKVLRKEPTSTPPNLAFNVGVGISHSTFGDPNVGHGPNGPRFPFGFDGGIGVGGLGNGVAPQCHNPGGSGIFRPMHECAKTPTAPPRPPKPEKYCSDPCETNPFKARRAPEPCHCPPPYGPGTPPVPTVPVPSMPPPSIPNLVPTATHPLGSAMGGASCAVGVASAGANPVGGANCGVGGVNCGVGGPNGANGGASGASSGANNGFGAPAGHKCPHPHCCHKRRGSAQASWGHGFQSIHTEQPRSCKYSYVFEKEPKKSSSNSSRRSTSSNESREQSPVAAAVQILPETLVTGAVNVASSAINTARTVIDMLIPRHDDVVTGHWEQIPTAVEDSLRVLSEMGFGNRDLNMMLLKRHNNDVPRVISELIQ